LSNEYNRRKHGASSIEEHKEEGEVKQTIWPAILFITVGFVSAEDSGKASPPSIAELIKKLSDNEQATREGAQKQLILLGDVATGDVEKAAHSDDAEVVLRAKLILSAYDKARAARRTELSRTFAGGPEQACEKVIQTAKEWDALVEACTSKSLQTALREKKIDFEKETVIAVALGSYDVGERSETCINDISVEADKWVVNYSFVSGEVDHGAHGNPLFVIKVPRVHKQIEFKKQNICYKK
jgi:hypothetical protein